MRTEPSTRTRRAVVVFALAVAAVASSLVVRGAGPRFYRDDPLSREPETADAAKVAARDIDLIPDLLLHMFTRPGDPAPNVRARDINTIDEVPDSSWFVNRIYAQPITTDQVARGPNTASGPAEGRWTVVRPKSAGFSPGFTARDSKGEMWFVAFDPKGHPHAATAAVAVAIRLFWALGYNQIESYISHIDPQQLGVDPNGTISQRPGARRRLKMGDVEAVLRRAAPEPDGTYRIIAGRVVPGKVVGPFKYYGTRPDDPNDLVPHEHRRSLRALKVFGAWTNLVDMKAGNTLDTVVEDKGRHVVRHYLQDVGSTFGTWCKRSSRVGRGLPVPGGPGPREEAAVHDGIRAEPLADGGLRPAARDRPVRGGHVRSESVGAARADARVSPRQGGRHLLGGPARDRLFRRTDPRGRPRRRVRATRRPKSSSATY